MNRSEELCKLLELEQMYKVKMYSGEYFIPESKLEEVIKYNVCDLDAHSSDIIKRAEKVYPDLTKPSNFVQLLKIHPKGTSSFFHKCEDFIHSIYGIKSLEDDIIGTIIDKVFPSLTTRHKNLAKQQAQATKWDY